MRVVNLSDEAQGAVEAMRPDDTRKKVEVYRETVERVKVGLNASVYLSYCNKVHYDTKTDRYLASFAGSEKTAILKVTDQVAEFLTTHLREGGYWQGRMESGWLVDVYLLRV